MVIPPWMQKRVGPEERVQMLEKLGFKNYAFMPHDKDILTYDGRLKLSVDTVSSAGLALLS